MGSTNGWTDSYSPPSPRSNIPHDFTSDAGPSSEGAYRRSSAGSQSETVLPSSAPPTPSVVGTTHPPQFIHTHHPRRGSMVPLGLNVISPRPPTHLPAAHDTTPTQSFQPAFQRYVGFNPVPFDVGPPRRGSGASSSSTLTQTRPMSTFPRRSSLTPSHASLAPPSPSRATAAGRHSRPTSSDGHARAQTDGTDRRGSMPHLHYGTRPWNPSLAPQRGSIEASVDDGFKFGSAVPVDVFAEAEAAEAERQRRQFMAATYGADGKRARERLSIGAGSSQGSPSTRRPSLMLWEKLGQRVTEASSAPALPSLIPMEAPRRGSLPIAIPGVRPPEIVTTRPLEPEPVREAPLRPLPPLLPLSDPGPRLLPSTLALQRATHLLHSRNLQAEPLPAPLPPSLHPPDPVDLAEFDIDFILAGSNAPVGPPSLQIGEEDTFAKFVGEFDDEYGGRRGEWTFRAASADRVQWESRGAGKYEVRSGEVRCLRSGAVWRIQRTGNRDYQLDRNGNVVFLASKAAHVELGGVKRRAVADLSQSAPLGAAMNALFPRKKRGSETPLKTEKKSGLGNVFKRGIASIKQSAAAAEEKRLQREEKERERVQSRSWSGHASSHRDHSSWMHPSGKTAAHYHTQPLPARKSSHHSGTATPSTSSSVMEEGEGRGWNGVPDEAIAAVLPIETDGTGPCSLAVRETKQALLVWYVPFNSDDDTTDFKRHQPLPFRSFRIVARVVELEELLNGASTPDRGTRVVAGRTFPTVIAVCHSRTQGVEFVLEGLDRLGFCAGESAWGPTGYEEWRGSGLSDAGRELLDLLWAGCTAVLGISA